MRLTKASSNMTIENQLRISESFYSVQGEGASSGVPAYFIRLQGCNLMCGGRDGKLVGEGKATWWCDTEYVWRQGNGKPFDYLIDEWTKDNILDWVLEGRVHLIWTGGEPTLPKHQRSIVGCINHLHQQYEGCSLYNEIETNGTCYIEDELFQENEDNDGIYGGKLILIDKGFVAMGSTVSFCYFFLFFFFFTKF